MKRVSHPILVSLGITSLVAGVIGLFLPLVPTTPFIILAAFFFSKSNPRLHAWLLNHKWFGSTLREWEEYGSISIRHKIIATVTVAISIGGSIYFFDIPRHAIIIALSTIVLVFIYVWTRPSHKTLRKNDSSSAAREKETLILTPKK